MKCETAKMLIDRLIEGSISSDELGQLRAHTEACESCASDLCDAENIEAILVDTFRTTGSEKADAAQEVLQRLPEVITANNKSIWKHAIAAGILLAVGLLAGFAIGTRQKSQALNQQVAIRVRENQGTILVKRHNSDYWTAVHDNSQVRLGDTFHTAPKAKLTLAFEDGSTIALEENSFLTLKEFDGEVDFYLEYGLTAAALESPHPPFFITTPHGRVEALGTEFTVKVD